MSFSKSEKPNKKGEEPIPRGLFENTHGIVTTTSNDLPGYRVVKVLGTVYGLVCRTRNWAVGLGAVAKSVFGGEIRPLTKLLYNSRQDAAERALGECMGLGGNALIALRFDVSSDQGFAEGELHIR